MTPFEEIANENDKELLSYAGSQEFAFEFIKGSKTLTATIPKNRNYFRRKLEQYKNEGVPEIELRHDGEDAQVWTFPVKYLKIQKPKKSREFTEEEKQVLRVRLAAARAVGKTAVLTDDEEEMLDEIGEEE